MNECETGAATEQDNNFDGQLILGIDRCVTASNELHHTRTMRRWQKNWAKKMGRDPALGSFPPHWQYHYPPLLFLKGSNDVPVPLLAGASHLGLSFKFIPTDGNPEFSYILKKQRDILDIILDGRVRVSVLLNSLGGNCRVQDNVIHFFDRIRENGGVIDAYATSFACSAAANIFSRADYKFVLPDSMVMWHAGSVEASPLSWMARSLTELNGEKYNPETENTAKIQKYKRDFPIFLRESVYPNLRDEVLAAVDNIFQDPENPRGEVWMSGRQLSHYGLATQTLSDLSDMEMFLSKRTGLHSPSLLKKKSYIDRFFSLSALEEHIRHNTPFSVKIEGTKENPWYTVEVISKEDTSFSPRLLTAEDFVAVDAYYQSHPDFYQPYLAGHNLRAARLVK